MSEQTMPEWLPVRTSDYRLRELRDRHYLTTGEPYIDEPDTCPACGGDGWYVGHEDGEAAGTETTLGVPT